MNSTVVYTRQFANFEGIDELLLSKADKVVLDNHLTDKNAHVALFESKEEKTKKGIAGGYTQSKK